MRPLPDFDSKSLRHPQTPKSHILVSASWSRTLTSDAVHTDFMLADRRETATTSHNH
jgi:hypothetical protein